MSREIELSRGRVAIVDDEDYSMLNRWKWSFNGTYATCGRYGTTRYLHRILMLSPPKGMDVDHINGDALDNRRENLRVVTHQKNCVNRHRLHANNKSGYNGVFWDAKAGSWRAYIDRGKRIYLGRHKTKEEAIAARLEAEKA